MLQFRDPRGTRRSVNAARPIDSETVQCADFAHTLLGRVPSPSSAGRERDAAIICASTNAAKRPDETRASLRRGFRN